MESEKVTNLADYLVGSIMSSDFNIEPWMKNRYSGKLQALVRCGDHVFIFDEDDLAAIKLLSQNVDSIYCDRYPNFIGLLEKIMYYD